MNLTRHHTRRLSIFDDDGQSLLKSSSVIFINLLLAKCGPVHYKRNAFNNCIGYYHIILQYEVFVMFMKGQRSLTDIDSKFVLLSSEFIAVHF